MAKGFRWTGNAVTEPLPKSPSLGATIQLLSGVLTYDWVSLGGLRPSRESRASSRGRPGLRKAGSDPAGRPPWARFGHRQRPRGPSPSLGRNCLSAAVTPALKRASVAPGIPVGGCVLWVVTS